MDRVWAFRLLASSPPSSLSTETLFQAIFVIFFFIVFLSLMNPLLWLSSDLRERRNKFQISQRYFWIKNICANTLSSFFLPPYERVDVFHFGQLWLKFAYTMDLMRTSRHRCNNWCTQVIEKECTNFIPIDPCNYI